MKTALTKEIEKALIKKYCVDQFRKYYGALEIPCNQFMGLGKENIDFATYEPASQDINCFEIKVTKADFNSQASLSFYGNKNYLVVSKKLGNYLMDCINNDKLDEINSWVHEEQMQSYNGTGIIVFDQKLSIVKPAKHRNIHLTQKANLIEGILRADCRDACKYYLT